MKVFEKVQEGFRHNGFDMMKTVYKVFGIVVYTKVEVIR